MSESDKQADENPNAEGWQRTRANPRWLIKYAIFLIIALGLGVWGAYDAFVAYPARGQFDAEWKLRTYLEQAEEARKLFDASVADPSEALAELRATPESALTEVERTRRAWLESLSLVESLGAVGRRNEDRNVVEKDEAGEAFDNTATYFDDPRAILDDLQSKHSGKSQPEPLTTFDIPVQYVIMFVGFAAGAWVLFGMVKKTRVKYRYEPSTMALELPDGRRVTPDMIEDVDKRNWYKFYATLHFADGSKPAKLDLLVHVPLEEWVLEMEPHTPNYEPEEEPEPEPLAQEGPGDGDAESSEEAAPTGSTESEGERNA